MKVNAIETIQREAIQCGHILGSGTFNDVYEITSTHSMHPQDKELNSKAYVLKTARNDLSTSHHEIGFHDLVRETTLLSILSHPNIISIHGMGGANDTNDGSFFIVLERLDIALAQQIDLWRRDRNHINQCYNRRERANKHQALFNHRIGIAQQIASALVYLHDHKIMFRDLKPSNVGLDHDDNAKIFDFGLAKMIPTDAKFHKATECVGSQRYMAPEVFWGLPYGLSVDSFSFAFLLWGLMTLEVPYQNTSPDTHAQKVYQQQRRPKIDRSWPKEIKEIIQNGWNHDPLARPSSSEINKLLLKLRNK